VNPRKETALAQKAEERPVLSKSAKRRLRIQKKKQALDNVAPAVPLNFQAPVISGAPTTSGLKTLPHSQSNQKNSGKVVLLSQGPDKGKKLQSGKQPVARSPVLPSTLGPQEGQKQKSVALNSNATNIS
jgi:hypothetical protein